MSTNRKTAARPHRHITIDEGVLHWLRPAPARTTTAFLHRCADCSICARRLMQAHAGATQAVAWERMPRASATAPQPAASVVAWTPAAWTAALKDVLERCATTRGDDRAGSIAQTWLLQPGMRADATLGVDLGRSTGTLVALPVPGLELKTSPYALSVIGVRGKVRRGPVLARARGQPLQVSVDPASGAIDVEVTVPSHRRGDQRLAILVAADDPAVAQVQILAGRRESVRMRARFAGLKPGRYLLALHLRTPAR